MSESSRHSQCPMEREWRNSRTSVHVLDVAESTNGNDTLSLSSATRAVFFWMAGKQEGVERSYAPTLLYLHSHYQVFCSKGNIFCVLACIRKLWQIPTTSMSYRLIAQPHSKVCIKKQETTNTFFSCICPVTLILFHASCALHCIIIYNIGENPLHNLLSLSPEAEPASRTVMTNHIPAMVL